MKNSVRMMGISLCVLMIVLLRELSLYLAESDPFYVTSTGWQSHLLQSALMLCAGYLLLFAYRKLRQEEKDLPLVLSILAAVVMAVTGAYLAYQNWMTVLQQLLLAVLPLILFHLIWFLRKLSRPGTPVLPTLLYYGITAILAWLLLDVLAARPEQRWEIFSLLTILVVSFVLWNSQRASLSHNLKVYGFKWLRKQERIKRFLLQWVPPVIALILILCFHERVQFILMTLFRPVTLGTDPWEVNWLGNRLLMMFCGWQGDLSLMEPHQLSRLPDSAPLLWLSQSMTLWAAMLMVALELILLYLLRNIGRSTKFRPFTLSTALVLAYTVQTVLGLAAELTLNTSSLLGPVFLRSPVWCLTLPLAAAADVYEPTLWKMLSDHAAEKLREFVKKKGIVKKTAFPEFTPETTTFPPWTGDMTLAPDLPPDTPLGYGDVPVRWVSQECGTDGTPLQVRYPQPKVTVYDGFPIRAAGRTYHHLNQLTSGRANPTHIYRKHDMYGREVFPVFRAFPAFDEFDAMYDDRLHRWYFLRENSSLTCVSCSDDSDEITVTEDMDIVPEICWDLMEQTNYFP